MTGLIFIFCISTCFFLLLLYFNVKSKHEETTKRLDIQEERFKRLLEVLKVDPEENEKKKKKKHANIDPKFATDPSSWSHEKLNGDVLKPKYDEADPNHLLYSKKIVFTGVFERHSRTAFAEAVQKVGADVDTSISKRTNYVVVGSDPGPKKMQMIEDLNSKGANIIVLSEKEIEGIVDVF